MQNIFKIFKRDLKKIFTNSMAIILAVGLCILPSLYAWFNIYANWDPYGSTGNMMVAVVNEDEGASYKGITIDVGNQIIENLKANDMIDWQFLDKEEAVEGIKSGKYYAGIEIPKGFSKSLTSIMTSSFEQPQITYYANEKKNAIATKITDKVVQTVQTEVNESFVITVVNMINSLLGTVVEESQATGTNMFQNLEQEIKTAKDSVNAIQETVTGFQNVMSLVNNLNTSLSGKELSEVLGNADTLIENTEDVIGAAQKTADTMLSSLGSSMTNISSSLDSAASVVSSVGNKVSDSSVSALKKTSSDLNKLKSETDKLSSLLTEINKALPIPLENIDKLIAKLNSAGNELSKLIGTVDTIAAGNYTGDVKAVADKLTKLSASIMDIGNDYSSNIEPKLNETISSLLKTLGNMSDIITALDKDMPSVNSLVSALQDSVKAGDTMIGSITTLLSTASNQLDNLYSKLSHLGQSDIVNAIINLTEGNADELGEFLACPVKVSTDKVYGIENYGSAMAPFYTTLAIWVGAMFLVAVVKTDVKGKKEFNRLKPHQEFFGRGLTFVFLSIIQSIIICIGDLVFFKIQCYHPFKFMLAGCVTALIYSLFIYSLAYSFGDIGKALAVIMLVVQIGGSGGTFPIDVTPSLFRNLNPFLPFTFTIEAMRECICGTYSNDYWIYLLKLCAYLLAALIVGLFIKALVKKPIRFFTKRIEETGLF